MKKETNQENLETNEIDNNNISSVENKTNDSKLDIIKENDSKQDSNTENVVNSKEVIVNELNSNEFEPEQKYKAKNTESIKKITFCISLSLCIILGIFLLLSTIFALLNINNNKIISGIYINDINVSGLTKEEGKEAVSTAITNNLSLNIKIYDGDYETSFLAEQISATFDIDNAINYAYSIGRSGNFIQNNYTILSALLETVHIEPVLKYDEEALNSIVSSIAEKLPNKMIEPSYYIEDSNLIITKGHSGNIVDEEQLKILLINTIKNTSSTNKEIKIPVNYVECKAIDIDSIYKEVKKDPKDAYYTNDPFVVYPHVNGVDFAISLKEAKKLLQEEKEEYVIPLKSITPSVTTNQIGTEAFPDLLSSFKTSYYESNVNRTTNLKLSAGKINGTVLLPGEVFSYNQVVGKRTIEAGYKDAAVFQGGKVVDGLGGGICQISSTLYDAVVLANLEIVERTNHGFVTSYLKSGRDATVVYGAIDFKFKNNRKYPIKIVSSVSNGIAEFKIFGKKEEVEYDVEIVTKTISSIPFKVRYVNDPTLPVGKTKVLQGGSNGCKVEAYKVLKLNGQTVSTTLLSRDTYNAMEKIIAKGTKK